MRRCPDRSAGRIGPVSIAASLSVLVAGRTLSGPAAPPVPLLPIVAIDSAIRGALGTATTEDDAWEVVKSMPDRNRGTAEKPETEFPIAKSGNEVPGIRGRLRSRDTGTIVLRTRPVLEAAFDRWIAAERTRRGLPAVVSKPGAPW